MPVSAASLNNPLSIVAVLSLSYTLHFRHVKATHFRVKLNGLYHILLTIFPRSPLLKLHEMSCIKMNDNLNLFTFSRL